MLLWHLKMEEGGQPVSAERAALGGRQITQCTQPSADDELPLYLVLPREIRGRQLKETSRAS